MEAHKHRHTWGYVVAERRGKKYLARRARVCLECGLFKFGTHTIKISQTRINMGTGKIINLGKLQIPVGTNLYD